MKRSCLFAAAMLVTSTAAFAQPNASALSPLAVAVACAPPPSLDEAPPHALRIVGAQDTIPRTLLGDRDLIVISGGTGAGVQLGQQYFVRRTITYGDSRRSRGARTLGWIRVVAVNDHTAIAQADHVCGGIAADDYLQPFVVPAIPAGADADDTPGQPDFTTLGRILVGDEDRVMVGAGDFALVDWRGSAGLVPGARVAVYRDHLGSGLPLVSVGAGVVISVNGPLALTRLSHTSDAVFSGDYVALQK
jgi:hypothetical protein